MYARDAPNIHGSGTEIRSYATAAELEAARSDGSLELGLDGTAFVQEYLPAAEEAIGRIEILAGDFCTRSGFGCSPGLQPLPCGRLELPGIADGVSGRGLPIERFDPPSELVEDTKRIVVAAGMEVGGV